MSILERLASNDIVEKGKTGEQDLSSKRYGQRFTRTEKAYVLKLAHETSGGLDSTPRAGVDSMLNEIMGFETTDSTVLYPAQIGNSWESDAVNALLKARTAMMQIHDLRGGSRNLRNPKVIRYECEIERADTELRGTIQRGLNHYL